MSFLKPAIEQYALIFSEPEPQVLKALSRFTYANMEVPQMVSGHLQGMVLRMFSHMLRPQHILEIGTFTGYSAICLAAGLHPKGILHTIDANHEATKVAKKFIGKARLTGKVKFYTGNALEIIPRIHAVFDLVFIDADKVNYSRYYDNVFRKVKKGGVILADNMFWDGKALKPASKQDADTRAIVRFAKKVHRDKRVECLILPVRDGLMVCRKK